MPYCFFVSFDSKPSPFLPFLIVNLNDSASSSLPAAPAREGRFASITLSSCSGLGDGFHLDSSGFPEIPGGTAEMAGGFQGQILRIPGAGPRRGIPGI